jgi:hypothetical protein
MGILLRSRIGENYWRLRLAVGSVGRIRHPVDGVA